MVKTKNIISPYRFHIVLIAGLYLFATGISWKILCQPEAQATFISLLSVGAIVATFGSAISSIGNILERDLLERIRLNLDVFYKQIIGQKDAWRRWPFIRRTSKMVLLDGSVHLSNLTNPPVRLNVGTHIIEITIPTILEDFFDLPLVKNLTLLILYHRSAITFLSNQEKQIIDTKTGLMSSDAYMAYECLLDIWKSILKFRFARYLAHFGIGLTLSGGLITAIYAIGCV